MNSTTGWPPTQILQRRSCASFMGGGIRSALKWHLRRTPILRWTYWKNSLITTTNGYAAAWHGIHDCPMHFVRELKRTKKPLLSDGLGRRRTGFGRRFADDWSNVKGPPQIQTVRRQLFPDPVNVLL